MTPYLPPNSNAAADYAAIQQGMRPQASPMSGMPTSPPPSIGDMGMMPALPSASTGANMSIPDPFVQSGGMNTSPEQAQGGVGQKPFEINATSILNALKSLNPNSKRIGAANKSADWKKNNPKRIRW